MHVIILGSAAGGGFPQWNCRCRMCRGVRSGELVAQPRLQSSVAVSADGATWVLLNASPDVRQQLERWLRPERSSEARMQPFAAVLLTDAQLDHAAGLLLLRESSQPLRVYCTDAAASDLERGLPALTLLAKYCGVERRPLPVEGPATLRELRIAEAPGLRVRALAVPGKAPPFSARRGNEIAGDNVALIITEALSGKTVVYAPGIGGWSAELAAEVDRASLALLDGTFWTDDEMARSGCGVKRARDMGHLALTDDQGGGALACYRESRCPKKVLVHINNTNPILADDGAERRQVEAAGVTVGVDGMSFQL